MKTAVISGGNGGLGRALTAGLQAQGWHVVAMDIATEGLEAGAALTPVRVDLTDGPALARACAGIVAARPSIDLVVYNAGVSQIGPFESASEESHRKVFEINYFAAVNMARGFLVPLRQSHGTHLAVSSVAGTTRPPVTPAISRSVSGITQPVPSSRIAVRPSVAPDPSGAGSPGSYSSGTVGGAVVAGSTPSLTRA